jgi:hypothetical protein
MMMEATMAAVERIDHSEQLPLNRRWTRPVRRRHTTPDPEEPLLCAACRNREARYGFTDPGSEEGRDSRPSTLCFECFRMELSRRRAVAARFARGWSGEQAPLPLEETLRSLSLRRRRAQIAARHAIGG